jgi:hypothetical protein
MIEDNPAWQMCFTCYGSGMQDSLNGPVTCTECRGDCRIRVRDERGRFAKSPAPIVQAAAVFLVAYVGLYLFILGASTVTP